MLDRVRYYRLLNIPDDLIGFCWLASPRYPYSVFIFGDTSTGVFQPCGTCFAVTSELLITCQHNMHGRRLTDYAFTLVCERKDGVIYCHGGLFRARVDRYNVDMDYALLVSVDKNDLTPIPLSIRPVEADRDLKVFHMPIDDFNDVEADDSLSVHTKWVKSTFPTAHHMKCSGGLYAGSSGSPFVMRDGRAVGFFCESISREAERM
jgi:hypothetical protein